ncbi:hypothetical protein APHWI1_0117 [Anaplasma phagocytophilum str. ApWI1]|uniref:Uncharacterized protein n=2 Tax=Anaplasma phagocytophilum TaxID=948 RepID=A0A0F3NB64_ANAPH|nr:hypothetical protein APHWEB_1395 [Anaplasma phagocytophilum str. Webster]KJV65285.1 hypothetical protein EPHNCH_0925 [Anaplasma phagocytophilum str. NCH-1]KJV82833.1 hypothetical protein APHHGE2_0915 [Anaplasma phagocytophilum str. HGE2]KJV85565.1 hypothetical protein APHWI1_0117 [Anaplasma phagocytophilum str. ApWI1]KJV86560.1 hypothetical protein APHNYW_1363 [Anaplasma phagocytophilum str. ApNYW]KJV98800.1 hypothetical protein OTSANNIE_0886 [Anaplasma phagocytophilum str. Annie]KJZ98203.
MPITHKSLGIQRAHTITLIIKNKTKGIRDSGKKELAFCFAVYHI